MIINQYLGHLVVVTIVVVYMLLLVLSSWRIDFCVKLVTGEAFDGLGRLYRDRFFGRSFETTKYPKHILAQIGYRRIKLTNSDELYSTLNIMKHC